MFLKVIQHLRSCEWDPRCPSFNQVKDNESHALPDA